LAVTMSTMSRPRTSGFVGVSLDGFLARPDGAIEWLEPYEGVEHGGSFHVPKPVCCNAISPRYRSPTRKRTRPLRV
jgi:hypothetical protein